MSDIDDEYAEAREAGFAQVNDALLSDTVKLLAPSEPIRLPADATVEEAVAKMVDHRRAGVVIVDDTGRLIGIFTERDALTRVLRRRRDPGETRLGDVLTPDPEALAAQDRICYAINRMYAAGYRTVPLVDADRRPVGIVTVNDVVKWLAELFPEAVLNLRPGDRLKRPLELDGG